MELILAIVGIALIAVIGVCFYIMRQGDADIQFIVDERTKFRLVDMTETTATFTCKVPFINRGTQDGTIMDAFTRHLLPYEQYDGVKVASRLELESRPRTDGYFEAIIIPYGTGQAVVITVEFTAVRGNIRQALAEMVDMPIDIVYQVVARSDWFITKARIIMTAEEIAEAIAAAQEQARGL